MMMFNLAKYCPPSPPKHETRPEFLGSILTSITPLTAMERLRLWRAKQNIIQLEEWKRLNREASK